MLLVWMMVTPALCRIPFVKQALCRPGMVQDSRSSGVSQALLLYRANPAPMGVGKVVPAHQGKPHKKTARMSTGGCAPKTRATPAAVLSPVPET